ncbi:hypothetical protein RJ639_043180 [Escallonia herrerae]|uniref:Reverse transcriptase Ty1/copia-type domain-containing protein n=1 Tax=Escallonia herrerae TaxID=1293975 RepID=A0AA89B014_9ASTE|nr:hypothetical protein RJ639_043180 [Escallonia herrerae]
MMFLLTALKVQYVLDPNLPPLPEITDNDSDKTKAARKKREADELVCRGHILNALSDRLYDLFTSSKCPKEIWKALENKYNNEKQGADKFLTLKYFEFTMNDSESEKSKSSKEKILDPDFIDSQAIAFLVEGDRENILKEIPMLLNMEDDPKTYSEAMASRDVAFWKEAINDEMDSILCNNTWALVELPQGSKPIGNAYGVIICLYVDDLLIFGENLEGIFETKEYLNSRFKMKDLNEVDTVLGIKELKK